MHIVASDREGPVQKERKILSYACTKEAPCRRKHVEAIHSPGGARSGVGGQHAVDHGGDEAEVLLPHGATLEAHAAGDADGGCVTV